MNENDNTVNLSEIWQIVLSQLELTLSPIAFKTWFSGSKLTSVTENLAQVSFKTAYIKDYVENHYRGIVKRAIEKATGNTDVEPVFNVGTTSEEKKSVDYSDPIFSNPQSSPTSNTQSELETNGMQSHPNQIQTQTEASALTDRIYAAGLNSRYSLEKFVVGSGNQLAHAAALAVIDNPGFTYNPLFIYGGVGLGKTHLMQAIGIEIIRRNLSMKVLYISAETFLNEMIEAIRFNKNLEFREKYRQIDTLIIDDIQTVSGKEGTQAELFHTYNILYQTNKQIIFAADRPPKVIKNLTDRLRSRFEGGMVADIKAPDEATRMVILQKKAEERKIFLPDNIMNLIATLESNSIRELEGALIKVSTHYQINNKDLSEDEIRQILHKDVDSRRKAIKPRDIFAEVANAFNVSIGDIKGKRRTNEIAIARQVSMYLLRTELSHTLEECANHVKRKDHTTVLHAVEKIEDRIAVDKAFEEKVAAIRRTINVKTQK